MQHYDVIVKVRPHINEPGKNLSDVNILADADIQECAYTHALQSYTVDMIVPADNMMDAILLASKQIFVPFEHCGSQIIPVSG